MTKPEARFKQGLALHQQGRYAEAERVYEKVLQYKPTHFDALHLLGVIALQTGRRERGVDLIDRAVSVNGKIAAAHGNRGNGLASLNRLEEAIASYDNAIALEPHYADAHSNRGIALVALQRYDEAIASHDRAIALKPDSAEAHYRRGNALAAMKRPDNAIASYDKAIALQPDFAEAYCNRGTALLQLHRLEDAVADYDRAIARKPDYADAYYNRGNTLRDLRRPTDALASYDAALALKPEFPEAWFTRGNALRDLQRHEEAFASYAKAIALRPEYAEAHWNQSLCCLAVGDYEQGWAKHEWRWRAEMAHLKPKLPGEPWLGDSPVDGKTILVLAEQGLGDSLQFCRYLPLLAKRATVILEAPRPIHRLLEGLEGVQQVLASGDARPHFDVWTTTVSLPLAFRTTLATIPSDVPYLHADPTASTKWRDRLAALPGRKIGIVWAGSPKLGDPRNNSLDSRRSMTLKDFAPLASIPGLAFVSLQKGEPAAQAVTPPEGMTLYDWADELNDFSDTAALADALDLIISVDTSVVHLAGALGKPVWVLNRYDQCWRWLRNRTDSPWYPSARLFQQPTPGDWSSVIRDVAAALRD